MQCWEKIALFEKILKLTKSDTFFPVWSLEMKKKFKKVVKYFHTVPQRYPHLENVDRSTVRWQSGC